MIVICEFCGKEFKTFKNWYDRNEHHTCSKNCSYKLKKKLSTKVCKFCKKEFCSKSHQKEREYCSRTCAGKASKLERVIKICPVCKKEFETTIGGYHEGKACSVDCGRKIKTIKHCLKFTCTICGKQYYRNQHDLSKIKGNVSKFCSKKCRGIGLSGKNSPNYKPNKEGIKDQLREWSKLVKIRDLYTCQICGSKKHLHAHHIMMRSKYKESALDVDNGITLCRTCHAEQHKDNLSIYNLIINN